MPTFFVSGAGVTVSGPPLLDGLRSTPTRLARSSETQLRTHLRVPQETVKRPVEFEVGARRRGIRMSLKT